MLLLLLLLFSSLHLPKVFITRPFLLLEHPEFNDGVAEVWVLLGQGHLLESEAVAEQLGEGRLDTLTPTLIGNDD